MRPRIRLHRITSSPISARRPQYQQCCRHAATATAITPAPLTESTPLPSHTPKYPPTQPPSHKPPEFRKSQLHRQYTSLLRSTPLILFFQHNNLRSTEWVGVRRELTAALRRVDEQQASEGRSDSDLADSIKLQIIQTSIFESALRVVEFYNPPSPPSPHSPDPSLPIQKIGDPLLVHSLSRDAHDAVLSKKNDHDLSTLMAGPIATLTFPVVSPAHLKAALSILSPKAPDFPPPTRRTNPGYHDPLVKSALQKMFLLGARVEGKVFDLEETRWIGKIQGGLDGVRAQVVALLQMAGGGAVTSMLERTGRSLWVTVEGRRGMLEEKEKGTAKAEKEE